MEVLLPAPLRNNSAHVSRLSFFYGGGIEFTASLLAIPAGEGGGGGNLPLHRSQEEAGKGERETQPQPTLLQIENMHANLEGTACMVPEK